MAEKTVRIATLRKMKSESRPIVVLTAYDAPSARIADEAGVDVLLVGDSLGNVLLGYDDTIPVTLDAMIHHTAAVARARPKALVVADMPFMTYHLSAEQALANAGRLIQEGGAEAVKLEGGATVAPTIARITDAGIPVMGHLGLTPQSIHQLSGYRVQGRDTSACERLLDDARALCQAGCFAIVLELTTDELTRAITEAVDCPTIGIGAGAGADGQVLVLHDMLGLTFGAAPRFVKRYADLRATMTDAIAAYCREVRDGAYPDESHTYHQDA